MQNNETAKIEIYIWVTLLFSGQKGQRKYSPKAWSLTIKEICPVNTMELFIGHRPADMCDPSARMFLHPVEHFVDSQVWFRPQHMGHNSLSKLTKDLAKEAGLEGKVTNHSWRRTGIQTCIDAGISPTTVQQYSGHANVESINDYAENSVEQQKEISSLVSTYTLGNKRAKPSVSTPLIPTFDLGLDTESEGMFLPPPQKKSAF